MTRVRTKVPTTEETVAEIHAYRFSAIYAAPGVGDCMVPLIPADATLAFDPNASVEPGDVVVLWFTADAARRRGMPGWVKRLVAPLPPAGYVGLITVEMLHPKRTFEIRSTDVVAVHKCIGPAVSNPEGGGAMIRAELIRQSAQRPALHSPVPVPKTQALCVSDLPPEPIKLEMLAAPPTGTVVHAATDDNNAPLIRKGEIVVVEHTGTAGWYPRDGGLFLIEYVSPRRGYAPERRTREIVQTFLGAKGGWYTGSLRRNSGIGFPFVDGPYRDENTLAEKLLGPVIGIIATEGR